MKHLRKFFESSITKEDILDNFAYLTDSLGDPHVSSSKFGNSIKWKISWSLKIDLSVLQDAKTLVSKLKEISSEIEDVLSATERLNDYNINMSISDELVIEIVPKNTGEDTFEFIKKYNSRCLYVYINEIERFFNSYGVRITKIDVDSSFNEITETNELDIHLSHSNHEAINRFKSLFDAEFQQKAEDIDREYYTHGGHTIISITPQEEKAYVDVSYR